jgi:hypothetical protein
MRTALLPRHGEVLSDHDAHVVHEGTRRRGEWLQAIGRNVVSHEPLARLVENVVRFKEHAAVGALAKHDHQWSARMLLHEVGEIVIAPMDTPDVGRDLILHG